jgi:ParB family transcriptional regulator, chromosome partitioning protein
VTVKPERHSALGRGLTSLIPQRGQQISTTEIPLARIRPNPRQPRQRMDPVELEALATSIRDHGVLQPVLVTETIDGYQLVAGERRFRASQMAGLERIPAVIRQLADRDQLELALVENLQRADLNAIETARAYKLLMETYDLTQEQLAERLGKSRSAVANTLRALQAPQILQDAVQDGKISEGHLRALLPLPLSDAIRALGDILAKGMSVREAEALARKMVHPTHPRKRARANGSDPDLAGVTAELRGALGTKVEITRGRKGGRIAIQFYSDEDFERLYELLVRAGRT